MKKFPGWFLLVLSLLSPGAARADSFPAVIKKVKPAVVAIGTFDIKTKPMVNFYGTGFLISPDGTVVTANHVIHALSRNLEREKLRIFFAGGGEEEKGAAAVVVAQSNEYDLAILKCLGKDLPYLKIGKSQQLQEGDEVAFSGYPYGNLLGLYPTTHRGRVSSISPNILPVATAAELNPAMVKALETKYNIYHLDAVAYPGNSGGPVFDPQTGEVLGVLVSGLIEKQAEGKLKLPTGISYAIPIEYLNKLPPANGKPSQVTVEKPAQNR